MAMSITSSTIISESATAIDESVSATAYDRKQFERWIDAKKEAQIGEIHTFRYNHREPAWKYTIAGLDEYQTYAKCVDDMTRLYKSMESLHEKLVAEHEQQKKQRGRVSSLHQKRPSTC